MEAPPLPRRTADVLAASKSWAGMLLPPHIEQALRAAGFRRPSPVQEAALPLARLGASLIVQAKAGTGKTLVFAAAAAERVELACSQPQVRGVEERRWRAPGGSCQLCRPCLARRV